MAYGEMSGQTGQAGRAPSTVQEIPERADEAMQSVRATLNDALASVTEKSREAARYADRQVQANPWTAVSIGFGLGVVFGALIAMAARPQHSIIERLRGH